MKTKSIVVLPSAARTAAVSAEIDNRLGAEDLHLSIDVTVLTAGASITPTISALDPASNTFYDLLVGVAIVATGKTVLKIGRGIGAAANVAATDFLPQNLRFSMAVADNKSVTYSVGVALG